MFKLNDETRQILGTQAVICHHFAKALRALGHRIPNKCEEEQAYVIHWMLCQYEQHGANWRDVITEQMAAARTALENAPPVALHPSGG